MGSSRQSMLTSWLASNSFDKDSISVLSADASFRQYYRATKSDTSYAVMDCPPEKENLESFLLITGKLKNAKLNVPEIFEVDQEKGFLVMTDLGDNLYSKKLNDETVYCLYTDALEAIVKMQTKVDCSGLKDFDKYYEEENNLFVDWFLKKHLKIALDVSLEKEITLEFNKINSIIKSIPKTFVHRDYHSRNLLITDTNNPGIIDYQDAVIGPVTYDLVSLLKDCYVSWNDGLIEDMLESFFNRMKSNTINNISDFRYWFEITGLQRHIKAIGIFSRLNYRDNKNNYLKDIPRTYTYIEKVLNKYEELSGLNKIFSDLVISNKINT
jgi:aminoglycoside/choline kinase family phosphotransferase